MLGRQRGLYCDHAAADVHPDSRRDDRALSWDDRADGGAHSQVSVGHEGHVACHDAKPAGAQCLLEGDGVNLGGPVVKPVSYLFHFGSVLWHCQCCVRCLDQNGGRPEARRAQSSPALLMANLLYSEEATGGCRASRLPVRTGTRQPGRMTIGARRRSGIVPDSYAECSRTPSRLSWYRTAVCAETHFWRACAGGRGGVPPASGGGAGR